MGNPAKFLRYPWPQSISGSSKGKRFLLSSMASQPISGLCSSKSLTELNRFISKNPGFSSFQSEKVLMGIWFLGEKVRSLGAVVPLSTSL